MAIENLYKNLNFPGSFFLRTAFVFLLLTCITKLISVGGGAPYLDQADPILQIPNRLFMLLAAALELVGIWSILYIRKASIPPLVVGILGAEFLAYRVASLLGQYPTPCPCLGSMTEWLHLPQRSVDNMLWAVAAWLCVGGFISFSRALRRENGDSTHLDVASESLGMGNA